MATLGSGIFFASVHCQGLVDQGPSPHLSIQNANQGLRDGQEGGW